MAKVILTLFAIIAGVILLGVLELAIIWLLHEYRWKK